MTKNELIKALAAFDGDACVIIDTGEQGWADIEELNADGDQIMIAMGDHPENRDRQCDVIKPAKGEGWYFVKLHQHTKKSKEYVDYFNEWAYYNGNSWEIDGLDETCRVIEIIKLKNPPF
tara:strand:+ start:151 stop:510 length:360 start_codon:yes stop_codon:yes gene_type:complete